MELKTDTPAYMLEIADRMRRVGANDADEGHRLYAMTERSFARGEITHDRIGDVYRHLAIHAGVIQPADHDRFRVCPTCEAVLDVEERRDGA